MKQVNKERCCHAVERGYASKYGLYDCNFTGPCEDRHEYNRQIFCRRELERVIAKDQVRK